MLLMKELHVRLYVPRRLPEADCEAVRRTLDSRRFRALLARTVRAVVREHPSLGRVRVSLTR